MARRSPRNPLSDIVDAAGAWLGGNRGTVQSSGAGAAWQASARSAAQGATRRVLAAGEEVLVQTAAWGGGISSQTARDLMYDRPGALGRGAREAAVSQVTGLVAGAAVGKAAQVAGQAIEATGIAARRSLNKSGDVLFLHGSETQNIKELKPVKQIIEDMDDLEQPVLTFGQRAHFPKGYVSPSPRTPNDLVSRGIVETADYATDSYNRMTGQPGSIYVARTSKSSIRNPESLDMDFMRRDPNWVHVKNPSKVVSEIKLTPDLLESRKALEAKVRKELRRAGARVPKKK